MSRKFVFGGSFSGFDSDALAFLTAAGITDPTITDAINILCKQMKFHGLWNKSRAIYPVVGGTASTHRWNLKNPQDTNAAFRLVFSGGWTHDSNQMKPNGTNAFSDTFFQVWANGLQNNLSLGYYTREAFLEANTSGRGTFGYSRGAPQGHVIIINRTTLNLASVMGADAQIANFNFGVAVNGLIQGSRTSSTSNKVYHNGLLKATNTAAQTGSVYTDTVRMGQISGLSVFTAVPCSFAYISEGLTDSEALAYYNIIQQFQTTLGRQI
jgi:hypothetical protein